MNRNWKEVRLGDVLRYVARPADVMSDHLYREIGIRSHGKGLFHKQPVVGHELGNKRVFWLEPGDFVLNIVFAWEGAVGQVTEAERGMIGSHRFPTFRCDEARLDLDFLVNYFRTPAGVELLSRVSPGGAGRNRTLSRGAFLEQQIPLPPLAEQQRLVARIDDLATQVYEALTLRRQAINETATLELRAFQDLFPKQNGGVVGDWIKFQTGYAFKSEWFSEVGVRLVRNANIGHGKLDWSETVCLPEARRSEFSRFELSVGDILITLDRPIIATGVKIARVMSEDLPCLLLQRVARAQFLGNSILPEYFFRCTRPVKAASR